MDIYRILVPTDFSPHSQVALRCAVSLAHAREAATITLLYVDPGVVPLYDERLGILEPNRMMAMMKLRIAERLVDVDVPVDERVVYGDPNEKIVEVACEHGADLIVMGTHGRSGLERVLMGSVAESVLRDAPCPVLFIKDAPTPPESAGGQGDMLTGENTAPDD
jgi:nucleotide-binding universal stress UspA family protein